MPAFVKYEYYSKSIWFGDNDFFGKNENLG